MTNRPFSSWSDITGIGHGLKWDSGQSDSSAGEVRSETPSSSEVEANTLSSTTGATTISITNGDTWQFSLGPLAPDDHGIKGDGVDGGCC
jgi:hypothetical protein